MSGLNFELSPAAAVALRAKANAGYHFCEASAVRAAFSSESTDQQFSACNGPLISSLSKTEFSACNGPLISPLRKTEFSACNGPVNNGPLS